MKRKISKALSIILTMTIVISVIIFAPVTVSAANTADSIVDIARAEIGNSYYQKYNGHKNAWCADFVKWCAKQAGVSSIFGSSSCYNMYEGMRGSCERVYSPQKGDIVFFYCNKCSTTAGKWCHVGIMEDSTHSIEGNNWSDGTSKVQRGKSYNHNGDLGYRHGDSSGCITRIYLRPNYDNKTYILPKQPGSISTDYNYYLPGDVIAHWSPSANSTSYWLQGYITYDTGSLKGTTYCFMDCNVGNVSSYKMTLMDTGRYTIYVSGVNENGKSSTISCSFNVIHKSNEPLLLKKYSYDGHTYKIYASSKTWDDAKIWCKNKGGYLATVTSSQEQNALWKSLEDYNNLNFYLGGSCTSGKWKWVTGEPFDFTKWASNEPDCAGGNENYLGLWGDVRTDENLYWNDFTCNYKYMAGFVYECDESNEKESHIDNLPTVTYSTYLKNFESKDIDNGNICGDIDGNRVRALKIDLNNCDGEVKYSCHFSNVGWSDFYNNGELCGSDNAGSSIEAFKVELVGNIANSYNIYYCSYTKNLGWLGWAKNGEISGTTGGSLPITAIKVILVPKIEYTSHLEDIGWQQFVNEDEISGTTGEKRRIEAIKLKLKDIAYCDIQYSTHIEDIGWGKNVYNGTLSGSTDLSLRSEAIKISLSDEANNKFDVLYKVHVAENGWTDWMKNGDVAGTTGKKLRLEAYRVKVVPKGFDKNISSYQKLTAEVYNVTFNPDGGLCNTSSKEVSYCGFYGTLPKPTKDKNIFIGWYDPADFNNKIEETSIFENKADVILYAKWAMINDIDLDNSVTVADATLLQKYVVGIATLTDDQKLLADCNGDGVIDVRDATYIQKTIVKIPV